MYKAIPGIFIKALIVLILVAVVASTAGCKSDQVRQYAVNTAVITSSLTELDAQFDNTSAQVLDLTVFNDDEIRRLKQVYDDLNILQQTIRNLIRHKGGLAQVLIDADQVNVLYDSGVLSYVEARGIIQAHWNELTPDVQAKLQRYDQQANSLHLAIDALLNQPEAKDITPVLRDILTIGAATAKVLVMSGAL